MISLKIYGTSTSTYQYIKKSIYDFIAFNQIDVAVDEINDVTRFIDDNINSVPTIVINEETQIEFSNGNDFQKNIKSVFHKLAEAEEKGQLRKILVAIDFSDTSVSALYFAKAFCKSCYYHLELLNVHHATPSDIRNFGDGSQETLETIKQKLHNLSESLESDFIGDFSNNVVVDSTVLTGLAAEEIVKISEHYEFIIMGTHGETGLIQRILGSVSETVASKSHCPVFLIPNKVNFYKANTIVVLNSNAGIDMEKLEDLFPNAGKVICNDIHSELLPQLLLREDVFFVMKRVDFINIFELIPDTKFKQFYELIQQKHKPLLVF